MAIANITVRKEMSLQRALTCTPTGDVIDISPAPAGIERAVCYAHMLGVRSIIDDIVFLNDTRICSNDEKGVHGIEFIPYFDGNLVYQKTGTSHDFYLIFSPDQIDSLKKSIGMQKPVFHIEADEIIIVPLCSGKGFVVIETKPNKKILLVKWATLFGAHRNKLSAKSIPLVWDGPHALYVAAPNSLVVGAIMKADDGVPVTRFFRGRDKTPIHSYLGTAPNSNSIWATDNDFFYRSKLSGEDVVISAATKEPMYHGVNSDELYATSKALVRHNGHKVWANNILITPSFCPEGWVITHAHGLLFFQESWIKLLFVGNMPPRK